MVATILYIKSIGGIRLFQEEPVQLATPIALTIEAVALPNESPLAADVRKALLYNGDPDYLLPATVIMDSVVKYHPRSGPYVSGWASVEMHRGYRGFGVFSDAYLPYDPNGATNETVRQCAMFNALTTAIKSAWPFDGPTDCAFPVTVDGTPVPFLSRFIGRRLADKEIKLSPEQALIITTKRSFDALPSDTFVPLDTRDAYRIPTVNVIMEWRERSVLKLKFPDITIKAEPTLMASINGDIFLDAIRWRLIQELAGKNFW